MASLSFTLILSGLLAMAAAYPSDKNAALEAIVESMMEELVGSEGGDVMETALEEENVDMAHLEEERLETALSEEVKKEAALNLLKEILENEDGPQDYDVEASIEQQGEGHKHDTVDFKCFCMGNL